MANFILGTWQIVPTNGFWSGQDVQESEFLLSYAVHSNITAFDTAQSYGKGRTEQVLGKILSRFPSKSFEVDTKIMPTTKEPLEVVKTSLNRLRIPKINRLYLHWPKTGFDNISFLEKFENLKKMGMIEKIGLCNAPLDFLQSVVCQLEKENVKLDCVQMPISLLWTRDLDGLVDFCHEKEIELVSYSPLGMGILSGKYSNTNKPNDERSSLFCFKEPCKKALSNLLAVLNEISLSYNVPCSQVALAWTASCGVDTVILGARNREQLKTNVNALSFKLPQTQFLELKKAGDVLAQCSTEVCDNIFSYNW